MKSIYQQFEDWVGQQDPEAAYDYTDSKSCALTRFGRECGFDHLVDVDSPAAVVPLHIWQAVNAGFAPSTFGDLAERLSQSRQALVPVRRGIAA